MGNICKDNFSKLFSNIFDEMRKEYNFDYLLLCEFFSRFFSLDNNNIFKIKKKKKIKNWQVIGATVIFDRGT